MPRRVEDIVPNERRSIRDIPVSREKVTPQVRSAEKRSLRAKGETELKIHKIEKKEDVATTMKKDDMRRMSMTPPVSKKRSPIKKRTWLFVTLGVIVIVLIASYIASTQFSSATFSITPKVIPVTVNNTLVVKPGVTSDISYDTVVLGGDESVSVPATDGPAVSVKATGKITLYNSYSSTSIRLIAGTRLSATNGLTYRLTSSVVIPGYTKSSGSVTPGTVSTSIAADQAGPNYNVSRSDSTGILKITAYNGSSKYDAVYAKLSSDISGGAIGTKKIVSPLAIASSTAVLKAALSRELLDKVKNAIPKDRIMYDSAYVLSFRSPVTSAGDKGQAVVTIQGTIYGITFDRTDLVRKLAGSQAVSTFGNLGFTSPGLENLAFNISNIKDFSPDKKGTLIFSIKGNMKLVGSIPVPALKNALAGKSLADSQIVLKSYSPVIENADGELVPPWAKIPTDLSRITINVKEN